jgi:hypothetical protein
MTGLWPILSTPWLHIRQEMPAYPSSQWDIKDGADLEAALQEEETTVILDGCGRLVKAESERWKS